MPLAQGTRLGPYLIEAPLGAGGMGEVYRARDTRLDRTVAIKVLPPDGARRAELRERFDREARAVSNLNHPHICALYDIVTAFPVPGRKWQISTAGGEKPHWRNDGREIVYLSADNHLTAVAVTPAAADFQIGAATALFAFQPQRPGTIFDMTPDAKRFLVNQAVVDFNAQPLTLVVPWKAEAAGGK